MSLDTPYRSPSDAFAATAKRRPDAPFLLAPASAGLPYAPEGFRIEYGVFKTEVDRLRAERKPTIPSMLGEEKAANPFLRADLPELAKAVSLAGQPAWKVFAEIRERKNRS